MIIRIGKHVATFVLAAVIVAALLLSVLIGRLAMGPIPMNWALRYIEQAMQSEGGIPAALTVNDMALAWNPDTSRIEFTARHVRVTQQVTSLTGVEQLGLTFSVLGLLQGQLHLKDITLIAPHFAFNLMPSDNTTPPQESKTFNENKRFLQQLHSVTVHGGIVNIQHADSDVHDVMDHIELKWARNLWSSTGTLTANLQMASSHELSPLHASLTENRDAIHILASIQNIMPDDIQLILRNVAPDSLPTTLSLDRLEMATSANADITLSPQGALEEIAGEITANNGRIRLPEYYQEPLPIQSLQLKGGYDAVHGNWQVDRFALTILDTNGAIPIVVTADGDTHARTIHTDIVLHDLQVSQLKRWWPLGVTPGAIEWFNRNLKAGKIPQLTATINLHAAPGQNYAVTDAHANWDLQNFTTTFMPNFPAITGINGKAALADDAVHMNIQSGHLGDIVLEPTTLDISGLDADTQMLKMNLEETGQLPSMLKLLDTPPYAYIRKMGVDAASASGGVGLNLKMEFPLLADLKISDIQYHAIANLSQVSLPRALMDKDVTNGRGVFEMDPQHLKITGQADIAAVPMAFTWQDFLAPKDGLMRQVNFSSELLDTDHARLGLPTAGRVNGATKLTGTYETRAAKSGRQNTLHAQMDFQNAAVHVDELSYLKLVGAPLSITTDMNLGNNIQFKLNANSKDLSASGDGTLDKNFNPIKLNFPIVKVGSKTDLQLGFEQAAAQRWILTGNALNLSQFLSPQPGGPKQPAAAPAPPRNIQMKLGTLYLAGQASLKNVQAELNQNGQQWDKIILHGTLTPKTPLDINWDVTAAGRKLFARTNDLGAVLSAFGITDAMAGGVLTMNGTSTEAETNADFLASGNAQIKNFRMHDIPLLGRLIAAVSPGGLLDTLRGRDGVVFDTFETQFEYNYQLLRLREGKMHGQSLGLSFEGDIHHAATPQTLAINGTIVPLYMVNNSLSGIPLLGNIISGKDGTGLFGFNYAATGTVDDPSVNVNPLSGFAPGFLRDLFFDNAGVPER